MKKVNVLDTCVIAKDPLSYKKIKGNEVIIPIHVLEELDKLKTYPGQVGKNSRIFIRELDDLCSKGNLVKGIKLENKTLFKVEGWQEKSKETLMDNKILSCAIKQSKRINVEVTLYTNDINLRVKARLAGLNSLAYDNENGKTTDLYSGSLQIKNPFLGKELSEKGFLNSDIEEFKDLLPNQFIHFVEDDGRGICLGRKIENKIKLIRSKTIWNLDARNKEQAFALDMLMDPKLPLVTLVGTAGSGKTLCAVAAGLESVLEKRLYTKMVIYRPIQPVGNDIGYLPGTAEEKLEPWMGAINDSLEFLFESKGSNNWENAVKMYKEKGRIKMEAITHIRGRSIPNAFIIIDEVQNLTKDEIKTILTRAGEGSKVVLTGDIEQIDTASLDALNNGLSYVVEKFKESELAGHVSFVKGERSPLATKAAELL